MTMGVAAEDLLYTDPCITVEVVQNVLAVLIQLRITAYNWHQLAFNDSSSVSVLA